MTSIRIIVPGQPIGKGRPRISTHGGFARAYTPPKTVRWEDGAALEMRVQAAAAGVSMMDGPLRMDIVAVFQRPQRMMGKKFENCRELHISKPDKDNVEKIVADALQKAGVIRDDCTICDGGTSKRYADKFESPHVQITIQTLTIGPQGGAIV